MCMRLLASYHASIHALPRGPDGEGLFCVYLLEVAFQVYFEVTAYITFKPGIRKL